MDSWAGYAAVSYGQRVDGFQPYCGQTSSLQPYCGQTSSLQPYCSQASLQPTYDPMFPALLHQKATYGRPDPDDWPRHHPFGVLPHEAAAATFPFPPQNPALNPHQVAARRSPTSHEVSPSFFQTNFPPTDPLQKISDYPSRLYPNLQTNESPLKDYRPYTRQDCDRLYDKPDLVKKTGLETDALSQLYPSLQQPQADLSKDYRFQLPEQDQISATKKSLEANDPREYSQSSPISFAMMDQRLRSPQFQQTTYRYSSVATPDEFQRSKSSESFSSNSSSDCSQRPSPLQQQQPTPYVYNNNNQNDCYKEPSAIDSHQRYPLTYSTIIPRDNRIENNRFDEVYNRQSWDDKRKFSYDVQRVQHFDNNQNSCRGDPMSLVRNLHNTPEKNSEAEKRNRERVVDELLREPPPAHNHTTSNQNYNFERWNLTTPGSKILAPVALSQNRLTGNDQPQSLVLPGALPYFPALQIQKQPSPLQLEKGEEKAPRLTIHEELAFLISDEAPLKVKFVPKISYKSCLDAYKRFINGTKEESPPRIIKKTFFPKESSNFYVVNPSESNKTHKEYPSDPQDDPRYYPLPKSSDMRTFDDSSDDSSEDSFTTSLVQRIKSNDSRQSSPSNIGRRCACKATSNNGIKKKKIVKDECSADILANSKTFLNNNLGKQSTVADRLSCKNNNCNAAVTGKCDNNNIQGSKSVTGQRAAPIKKVCRKSKPSCTSLSSFKVDEFLVQKSDKDIVYPPIWRVKEKNILQKFQHFVKDGVSLYIGLPSVVAWSLQNKNLYHSVPVSIAFLNKSAASSIVQVLKYPFQPSRQEKQFTDNYLKDVAHLQDSFEVFTQTLFSQALDSNFLQEIYLEKDEYFLARVREVEGIMNGFRTRICMVLSWPSSSIEAVARWPSYRLAPGSRPSRTCVCTKSPASCLLVLHGNPYNPQTLHRVTSSNLPINKELAVCSGCVKYVELLHTVCHQKLGLFVCCEEHVNKARDPSKDTTSLLNYLLADQPFLSQLFREVRLTWCKIERCLRDNPSDVKIL